MDDKNEFENKMDEPRKPVEFYETLDKNEVQHPEAPSSLTISENRGNNWIDQVDIDSLHNRWNSIQAEFVEDPRMAVEKGDALVSETIGHIERQINEQHRKLNQQISSHNDLSTESLRVLLQDYRKLLDSLLR